MSPVSYLPKGKALRVKVKNVIGGLRLKLNPSSFNAKVSAPPFDLYRNLVEMANEGITMTDANDHLIFVNKKFARSLGYRVSELVGRSLRTLSPKAFEVKKGGKIETRKMGQKCRHEVTLVHRDGTEKSFWLSSSPMYSNPHEFIGSIGIYSDVMKKKVIEKKLQKKVKFIKTLYRVYSHARMTNSLSSVFNGVAQEIVQAFTDCKYSKARLIFDRRTYSHPKKLGRFFSKVKMPLVIDGVRRGVLEVGCGNKIVYENLPLSLRAERELVKNVANMLCRHVQAREILGRYREVVHKSFTAIIIVRDHKIIFANPRFYRMFRYQEGQVLGCRIQKFFPYYKPYRCASSRTKESFGQRSSGEIFNIALITQRIYYSGRPAVLVRINDTSDLKKAQEKLSNFNSELRKTVREKTLHLEEANKRLKSLNQIKDEFIAVTSHELRSPLTSIRGYLSFLTEEESLSQMSEPYREYLIRAYSTTDSLNYLINNILDVSRLDMGRFELQKQEVDLIRLIRSILDSLAFQVSEARLELQFVNNTCNKEIICLIDPIRMSQVLRNVLDNAIKFTKKGKKIRVTVRCKTDWCTVEVADQGVGIPKSKLNQVFDKFIQVRNTQTRYKGGVGLGLFIAKRIVELHQGLIHAEQNKDGGITMFIQLPRNH